ncbi:LON peptidase substrate-binding domain-containing protein [Lacisediminimonas profundi]|uniref:LON peptidase substrate-binding domain-containing protein n=1 Tax=Lacisediminimonas profundi TaxID=2603856 RepID=UPI00124B0D23|nr:LON peptidase substrate-binding domain-containing protein [Lacisediminimonas profundi]
MPADPRWIPLFPLNTVLFPGGVLPLRVFETRYIDMVRECMRRELPFGVVRILAGSEVGQAAEPDAVGCLARIVEWDMPELGVLMLRTLGGQRFRILEKRVLKDQRLEARVEMIEDDVTELVSQSHVACASALKTVIAEINQKGRAGHGDAFISPFDEPLRLDDAGWVANRWCEILPVSLQAKQKLLELEDAQSRLAIVHQYLQQHKIL